MKTRYLLNALLLAAITVCLFGCGKEEPSAAEMLLSQKPEQSIPGPGQGILGYNEPLESQKSVGLRATTRGRLLAISVHNQSSEAIIVGPEQFRILLPDHRQYSFTKERNDLSGFPVKELESGQRDVFTVAVGGLPSVDGLPLVFNYPPAGILMRVQIEPVQSGSSWE